MSTYYLFDLHRADVDLLTARPVDVATTTPLSPSLRVDGLTPIRVPDGVRVANPANLGELLTQKHTGLLAQYPGFQNIVFDDLLDASGIDATTVDSARLGSRSTIGGSFRSLPIDLSGFILSQFVVVYEAYRWQYVDARDARVERHYVEEDATAFSVSVSADGGGTFVETTSGAIATFDPSSTGSSLVVGVGAPRSGSWAVIY